MPPPSPGLVPALIIMGVVMIGIIAIAYIAVSALGGLGLQEVATAMLAVVGISLALIPVSVALLALSVAGAIIMGSGGTMLVALAIGIGALGVAMVGIIGLGKLMVAMSKGITTNQVINASLFAVVSLEAAVLALAGIAVVAAGAAVATAGTPLVLAGIGALILVMPLVAILGLMLVEFSKKITTEELGKASMLAVISLEALVMVLAGLGIVAVTGAVIAAAGWLAFVALPAMLGVLPLIALVGLELVGLSADLSDDALMKASKLTVICLEALSLVFAGIMVMTIVGVAGPLVALARLVGGYLLKQVVIDVVDIASVIVTKAAGLPADIDKKVSAIVMAFDAVSRLVSAIPSILEASKKTTTVGSMETVEPQVKELTDFVEKLFGKSGTGLIGLVEKVIEAVRSIGASETALKAASALASVMAAVSEVIKGLSPSPGFSEALKSAASTWGGEEVGLMSAFSENAEKLLLIIAPPGGGGLIGTVVKLLTSPDVQSGFNETSIKGIQAIAEFMKVIPELAKALTPPDSVVQAAKEANGFWTGPGAGPLLDEFRKTATEMGKSLGGKDGLLAAVTGSATTIIESLAKNKIDAGQTTVLQAVAPLLKSMFEVISSVISAAPAASKMNKEQMVAFTGVLTGMKDAVGGIFTAINDSIPKMVDAVQAAIQSLSGVDPEVTKTGIGFIKDIMGIVGEIPKLLQVLSNAGGEGVAFGDAQSQQLTTMIETVVSTLEAVMGTGGSGNTAFDRLAAVFEKVGSIATQVGQKEGVTQIKSIFEVIQGVFNVTKEIKDAFKGGFTAENATEVKTIIDNAVGMIVDISDSSFQSLSDALATSKEFSASVKGGAESFKSAIQVLKDMSPVLKDVSTTMATLSTETAAASFKPIDFTPHLSFMTNVKSFLKSVMGDSKGIGNEMAAAVNQTKSLLQSSIKPTIVLIDQIIAETIKLQTQLEKGTSLNIPAKLRVFAGKSMATMGASGKYKISTSPVEVNVNFAIAIDAVKLEKVLVQRKGSIIRDRVHYLLGLTVGGESKKVYDMQKDGKSDPALTNFMNDGKLGEDPEQGARIVAPQYDTKR